MQTTTVRVRKLTQEKLKKLSADEGTSITDVIDKLLEEHRKSFWNGFDEEAETFLNREERSSRKTFEGAIGDGIEKP